MRIETDVQAEWALGKIRGIRAEAKRITGVCEEAIASYEKRMKDAKDKAQREEEFFASMLADYFSTRPDELLRKTKTGNRKYALVSGDIEWRKPSVEYKHDDEILVGELAQNGMSDFVQVAQEPRWAEIKKLLHHDETGVYIETCDENGEIHRVYLQGVQAQKVPESIKVSVKDGPAIMEGEDDDGIQ